MPHRLRYGWSLLVWLTLLTGCANSYFVPMELAPSRIERTPAGTEPASRPILHVITHSDGLGWQVSATQEWIDREHVTEQEFWKGWVYTPAKNSAVQAGYTAGTVITCPGSILAHVFIRMIRVVGLLDQAEPTWHYIKGLCVAPLLGLDPTTPQWQTQAGPTHDVTPVSQRVTRPLTAGRLQLRWMHKHFDPVGTEYVITKESPTLDIRLREVAAVLLPTHHPDILRQGQLEITLHTSEGFTITTPISISPATLKTALESDLIRRPVSDWPTSLRIRLETQDSTLTSLTQTLLTELRLPIVTRGTTATSLYAAQNQEVSPLFQEEASNSIGHWTGATVLLSLTSTRITETTNLFVATASSIETGLILGQFTLEGRAGLSPEVASTLRAQLTQLLTGDGLAVRRGTMIEERR
jgi:hypothetical protein